MGVSMESRERRSDKDYVANRNTMNRTWGCVRLLVINVCLWGVLLWRPQCVRRVQRRGALSLHEPRAVRLSGSDARCGCGGWRRCRVCRGHGRG